jgi:acylphosphatase
MAAIARHLTIHGRVQGVWYRAWTVETARGLNLTGWVRNRANGSVEALVQGESGAVEQFIALAHEGPAAAQVTRIDLSEIAAGTLDSFEKRATA